MATFEVDHILPEALLKTPDKLTEALHDFGLPEGFNVNDYGNWLPACRQCNGRKLNHIFRATPIVQIALDRARGKAEEARRRSEKFVSDREFEVALATVQKAAETGAVPERFVDLIAPLSLNYAREHLGSELRPVLHVTPSKVLPRTPDMVEVLDV